MIIQNSFLKKSLYLFSFVLLFLLASCNSGDNRNNVAADFIPSEKRTESFTNQQNAEISVDRKIIKEGNLRFETSNVKETDRFIRNVVAELGGYVGNENVYSFDDRIEHTLIARVPEDKFNSLLEKISSVAEKIESKNVSSLDVTEEYIDVEARVKTKKELESRYKEILKQASRVDEILNIEREIGNLRAEIESLEGRLNYLKNRVALSSLTITYYEKVSSPFGFLSKFFQAFKNGWNYLLWFIIILTSLWPFILIVVIILFMVNTTRKKNLAKKITG